MPLVKVEQINEDTKILIWNLTEDIAFFENHLHDLYGESVPWTDMKDKRKKEFLATRYLIQLGLPPGMTVRDIIKDKDGCPRLINSKRYFGISHTKNYVSCVVSKSRAGCDIERFQDRILAMAHRFMTDKEQHWAFGTNQLEKTHLIWGIKESAFKTWGRKQIDWKKHIHLDAIPWDLSGGTFTGSIGNHTGTISFRGGYEYFSEVVFVWSIES